MSVIKEIKVASIRVNPNQPRGYFGSEQLEELAISIRENGLIQPITVRRVEGAYELIAGERRLRAYQYLQYSSIPAYIITSSDKESVNLALIENIQRENLSAIEEAKAYLQIMELNELTQSDLAKKLGKSQPSIANKIRLLNLDVNIQNAVDKKVISERHARTLIGLAEERQNELLTQILRDNLTVAQTEKITKPKKSKTSAKGYSRNVQIGINTIKKAYEMVEKSGLDIRIMEQEEEEEVKIEIIISK